MTPKQDDRIGRVEMWRKGGCPDDDFFQIEKLVKSVTRHKAAPRAQNEAFVKALETMPIKNKENV